MRGRARWASTASVAAVLALSSPAAAESLVVQYTAETGCPSRQAFIDELNARTVRIRQPRPFEQPWRIRASLRAVSSQYHGDVRIDGPDASSTTRRIVGVDCAEVASALTLIAALSIEATAEARDSAAPSRHPTASLRRDVEMPADLGLADKPAADEQSLANGRHDWLVGVQALSMGAVGPEAMQGAAVVVGYEPTRRVLDLRLRLSAAWLPRRGFAVNGSDTELGWLGGRLESCPIRLRMEGAALLAPCAMASVARLEARGQFPGGTSEARLWADVGASGNLEIELFGDVLLNLQAALMAPLTRDTLVVEGPRAVVHDTPALGALFGIGLALRFP